MPHACRRAPPAVRDPARHPDASASKKFSPRMNADAGATDGATKPIIQPPQNSHPRSSAAKYSCLRPQPPQASPSTGAALRTIRPAQPGAPTRIDDPHPLRPPRPCKSSRRNPYAQSARTPGVPPPCFAPPRHPTARCIRPPHPPPPAPPPPDHRITTARHDPYAQRTGLRPPKARPRSSAAPPGPAARPRKLRAATRTPREASPHPTTQPARATHAVRQPVSARRNPYAQRNRPAPTPPGRPTRAPTPIHICPPQPVRPEKPRIAPATSPRAPRPPQWIFLPTRPGPSPRRALRRAPARRPPNTSPAQTPPPHPRHIHAANRDTVLSHRPNRGVRPPRRRSSR